MVWGFLLVFLRVFIGDSDSLLSAVGIYASFELFCFFFSLSISFHSNPTRVILPFKEFGFQISVIQIFPLESQLKERGIPCESQAKFKENKNSSNMVRRKKKKSPSPFYTDVMTIFVWKGSTFPR